MIQHFFEKRQQFASYYISHPVRVHDEGGSRLPKTPSSARKVQLTKSGSNASVPGTLNRNSHRLSMGSAAAGTG